MKQPEQLNELTMEAISAVKKVLVPQVLTVRESDEIMRTVFGYFVTNSLRNIPQDKWGEYMRDLITQLLQCMCACLETAEELENKDIKEEKNSKETFH